MTRPAKGTKEYWAWRRRLREAGPQFPKLTKEQFAKVREREELYLAGIENTLEHKPSTYRRRSKRRA